MLDLHVRPIITKVTRSVRITTSNTSTGHHRHTMASMMEKTARPFLARLSHLSHPRLHPARTTHTTITATTSGQASSPGS